MRERGILRRGDVVDQPEPAEAAIRDWCINYLVSCLNVPATRIHPEVKFARLGMDSAMAVYFLLGLEEWLGRELPQDVVFEYPTIAQLAHHLAGAPTSPS
jgi:acyl carrier protein